MTMPPWLLDLVKQAILDILREVFGSHGVQPKAPPPP